MSEESTPPPIPVREVHYHAAQAVRDFFTDPKIANQVVDIVVRKRPANWGRRSNAPYYTEQRALQIKAVIDRMLETKQDQIYYYKDFPNIRPNTLYLRINQALKYLLDMMDPDLVYRRWTTMVNTTKERMVGVRFSWKDEFRTTPVVPIVAAGLQGAQPVIQKELQRIPWFQEQIDKFLEDPSRGRLLLSELALTPEQIEEVKTSLSHCKGIMHVVRSSEIKIVKVRE